jgi:myosin heavy subunit
VAEKNSQVRKLCTDFSNEKLKLQKMKEEVDRELVRRNNDIKGLQAQLDRLKQEYGNRSAAAWSEDMQRKDAEIKRLINQNTEASRRFEKLQQDLDQTRRSAESSMKKGAQELQQRDAQIRGLNETSTAAQGSVKSLEQELAEVKRTKDATVKTVQEDATRKSQNARDRLEALENRLSEANSAKRAVEIRFSDLEKRSGDDIQQQQKEVAGLQQTLENSNRRLKEMDERHIQQQEVVRQKDSNAEKLKHENETLKQDTASLKHETERLKHETEKQKHETDKLKQDIEKQKHEAEKQKHEAEKQKHDAEKLKHETEKLKQDIEKLQQERAKATANAVQIPNSQPQEDSQDQTSTSATKKLRKAVDRNARSVSKQNSSAASASESQLTSDVLDSTQPRSTGASIFGPFSQPRSNSYNTDRPNSSQQEDDEMLDMGNSQFPFLKTASRPVSSQSEAQRAFSLGSQEVLTAEGVRFRSQRSQQQAQVQSQLPGRVSPSSSLSEPRELDPSYRDALEESQSQAQTQLSEQESQDVALQSQQQSMGLSIFNDLAVAPHAFETPMKAGGKNLQGMGKKLTPRPESQPRQNKPEALQPITTPKPSKGSALSTQVQKKVSALDSNPYSFKTVSSGKGKTVTYDVPDAEDDNGDDDNYSAPSSSVRGSRSPQKRPAPQSSKTNKRQRTETATPGTAPTSQRSVTATPRRSQTTSATPSTQRRRSGRTSKK